MSDAMSDAKSDAKSDALSDTHGAALKVRAADILIRCLAATWRFTPPTDTLPERCVVAFWHRDMLAMWKYFSGTQSTGVTSLSRDGDILARLLHSWSYSVIRGSSSKGGKEVLQSMVEAATRSKVLVTPDGPRGPAGQCKAGAVICAQRAQVPLVFLELECSRFYTLQRSWDRFRIPLPFARIRLRVRSMHSVEATWDSQTIDALLASLSDPSQYLTE